MKKRLLGISIIVAAMVVMAGCGSSNERTITGDVKNNIQSDEGQTADNKLGENDNKSDKNVITFKTNNTEIKIGAEAKKIIEALGNPISKFESPSCAFGDLDVMYTYNGYEVDTYQMNGIDYISSVILLDDSVSTNEGLYIGASSDDVQKIYGTPTTQKEESYIYKYSDMKLVVVIKNNKVESIQYLNLMMD